MTTAASHLPGVTTLRDPRALLVGLHVPFVGFTVAQAAFGIAFGGETRWGALPLVLIAGAIQLRHSLAAAEGRRAEGWLLSLLVLLAIAWVPLFPIGEQWATFQWYAIASCLMLLPPRLGWSVAIASAVAMGVRSAMLSATETLGTQLWGLAYSSAIMLTGGGGLYWAARLVWHFDALRDARADLAELAIGRERQRVSRDLHDLLGQSLSAVSLKGDLAIGLLGRQQIAPAAAEIESLVSVARSALHDLRGVAHHELAIAFDTELHRAVELLSSVGIDARVETIAVPSAVDELFAWALREGVTNVLRHSTATVCTICVVRRAGMLRLELANDAAAPATRGGHGLTGLAARAAAFGGDARGRLTDDGGFLLAVDVPEPVT